MTPPPVFARGDMERAKKKRRGKKNKLEEDYDAHLSKRLLAGEIAWYRFEAMRLRLADGAYYCPDFTVIDATGLLEYHEVKGHWKEAARVRIKVAAEEFPHFHFVAIRRPKKSDPWDFEEF